MWYIFITSTKEYPSAPQYQVITKPLDEIENYWCERGIVIGPFASKAIAEAHRVTTNV